MRGSNNDRAKHVHTWAPMPFLDVAVRYTIVLADYSQFYGFLSHASCYFAHNVCMRVGAVQHSPSPLFTLDTRLSGSQPQAKSVDCMVDVFSTMPVMFWRLFQHSCVHQVLACVCVWFMNVLGRVI